LRSFAYDEAGFFSADGASAEIAEKRRLGFHALAESFEKQFPKTLRAAETFLNGISDLRFTDTNRVPFPFQKLVRERLNVASLAVASEGPSVVDLDGNKTLDVSGSYGVNVCGYDNYKRWMEEGWEATKNLGPVLGPLHPIVGENLAMIKAVSKLDEVSFHMSGTEAIMCAVRLAAFNKRRKLVVCFAGAYHGWWDGVQPGPGNERKITDVLPLKDMSPASLAAIKARASEIACVVVNPLQGFNPNSPPPNDLVLMTSAIRKAASNETMDHYAVWLKTLRALCTECDVPLVFDEVYTGFRMAPGGAQEYYGVNADMVVYGKTLGGGMPVGVVCGKKELMRRFDPEHPLRVSYVIGTFSALPLTMGSMNAFLKWATSASARETYDRVGSEFDAWIKGTNVELKKANLPISVHNLTTVWTIIFDQPGRYHWMLQYYLRAEGIALSWVGTGRLLVSLDFQETDFATCRASLLRAAKRMKDDGWWNLGTAERPITAASISQGMGKEMAYHTVMKTVREGLLAEILCLPEQDGPRAPVATPPETLREFYEEVMRRKHDDHKASHSNCVNQFMHLISSTIFIFNYYTIWGDCTTTMVLGLFSLFLRQSGHAIFEPPCHDEEELLLGFNTRSKCFVVAGYTLAPIVTLLQLSGSVNFVQALEPVARSWLLVTLFFVLGHTGLLWMQYGFKIAMVWLVKLITDPFTDVAAYYPSALNVWSSPDWKTAGWDTFQAHLRGDPKASGEKKAQ
jgi:glutamate-1-semialdehyde 2,1-aminomutase